MSVSDTTPAPLPRIDPRLDWQPRHDPKSQNFPIRSAIGTVEERPRAWKLGAVLDQGSEGACVGFGWTGELLSSPKPDFDASAAQGNQYALGIYREAQTIDEWPGEDYSGTSVLAGAKVVHGRGHVDAYRWCFSIEDVRDAVIAEGPVVVGIPWHENMYYTSDSGLVNVEGNVVGGHCILITGYHPGIRLRGEDYRERFRVFRWRNSWGPDYGVGGNGFVRYEDLRDLLKEWGEACCPTGRKTVRVSKT